MVHNDGNRVDWSLGLIVKLIFGKDNVIRSAVLRTKNGLLTRPVTKLYPLELSLDNEQSRDEIVLRPRRRAFTNALNKFKTDDQM